MEIDAECVYVHFGQDGLGDFDWSNKADDTPVSLALMATNSEVPYCSKCSKSYKQLLENYQTERDNFQKARSEILGYQMSLESLEVILKTHEKNEYAWGDKYEQMEYDLKLRDLKLEEKQKELDQVLKERDDFKDLGLSLVVVWKVTIHLGIQIRLNLWIDELAIRNKVVNQENRKSSQPEIDRNKVIIEDWVDSDDEETVLNFSEIQKKTVLNLENSETSFEKRYPHQKRSFIPSAVLIREGLKSTARPKMTQTVPSKSTANVFYRGTARTRVPQRLDNVRPRTLSFSPSTRSSTTRTPYKPQRPKKIMKSIWVKKASTVGSQVVLPPNVSVKGIAMIKPTQTWRPKGDYLDSVNRDNGSYTLKQFEYVTPLGKKCMLNNLQILKILRIQTRSTELSRHFMACIKPQEHGMKDFPLLGRISGKGTIKTSCLDFEKVSYVEELKFNLLSVSQICDKKHNVLFTDKECLILSPKFKFVDEDLVILRAPRKNDVYSLDLKNIIPSGGITCLVCKAIKDEAVLWH
ncbi:hypothetical protein Tco_0494363 [Tanacetum coccineum]